jgi:hypothetical protein
MLLLPAAFFHLNFSPLSSITWHEAISEGDRIVSFFSADQAKSTVASQDQAGTGESMASPAAR